MGNLFELEDLGAQNLKGIAEPVRAWAALRPATVESRFEALHTSGVTEGPNYDLRNNSGSLGDVRRQRRRLFCRCRIRKPIQRRRCHQIS